MVDAAIRFGGYTVSTYIYEERLCLILTHKTLYNHPPFGLTSRCRMIFVNDEKREYLVHILMREVERGTFEPSTCVEKLLHLCSKYSSNLYAYKFCPGLNPTEYESQKEVIRFDIKSLRKSTEPFLRIDSVNCLLWFELGKTSSKQRRETSEVLCPSCTRLKSDISYQMKRTEEESPSKKLRRQQSSSHARLTYMSPTSNLQRKTNQKQQRHCKLEAYQETEVTLDDQQSDEMGSIMSIIEKEYQDDLETLLSEGILLYL